MSTTGCSALCVSFRPGSYSLFRRYGDPDTAVSNVLTIRASCNTSNASVLTVNPAQNIMLAVLEDSKEGVFKVC